MEAEDVIVETKKNKRGKHNLLSKQRIATVTVRGLQQKLMETGLNISMETIVYLKPFFINYPCEKEKEMALCLSK